MAKSKPFYLNPDLVKARCLSARFLSRKTPERAAKEMGYANTSMVSKMERSSSKTGINFTYIARASLCYGVSVDYLLGMSNYPERDPRSVEQLAVYSSVQQFAYRMLNELTESILKGASAQVLETHLFMLCEEVENLLNALNRVRELNPDFDEEIRGGALLLKAMKKTTEKVIQSRHRLSKETFEDNVLRHFRALLEDGQPSQLDMIGYQYGEQARESKKND